MADSTPTAVVATLPANGAPVSRLRRAIFAFGVTFFGMCIMSFFGIYHFPVDKDITVQVVKSIADLSIFVGIGYIGGSVVDYSGMLGSLGAKFGLKIPITKDKSAGGDDDSAEGN